MTRKHICLCQQSCCGNFQDQSTDTSADGVRPPHKVCSRRRSSIHPAEMCTPRFNKHKDLQAHVKHAHTCYHGPQRYSRVSAERSASVLNCKSKNKKSYHYEDSSTDTRSVSSISQCTSALSVDVSCEMAAVNRELDALLSRYERSLGKGGRMTPVPPKSLQPRPPSILRENLAATTKLTGSKSFQQNEQIANSTLTPKNHSMKVPSTNPVRLEESESVEMLKNMWEELRLQGMVPSNEEMGKNIQKIYTKMKLDDSSEVKIDFGGLASMAKTPLPTDKQVPNNPVQSGTKSSVATQTKFGFERFLINCNHNDFPLNNRGDGDNNLYSLNKRIQMKLSNKKYSESPKLFCSGDGDVPRANENLDVYKDIVNPSNKSLPSDRMETIMLAAQNGLDTLNKLKNFNDLTLANEIKINTFKRPPTDNISFEKRYQSRNHIYQATIKESLGRIETSLKSKDYLNSLYVPEPEKTPSMYTVKQTNENLDSTKISKNPYTKGSNTLKFLAADKKGFDVNTDSSEEKRFERRNLHQTLSTSNLQFKSEIPLEYSYRGNKPISELSKPSTEQASDNQTPTSSESINSEKREKSFGDVKGASLCSNQKGNNTDSELVEEQNVSNESIYEENKNGTITNKKIFSSSINKADSIGQSNSAVPQTEKFDGSELANMTMCDKNGRLFEKYISEENHQENVHLKEAMKKENLEKLDPSLCAELIRRVTEAMMTCHPSQETDELSSGKSLLHLLKQLRSEILKHIQVQVKQIEDLDKYLEYVGINKLSLQSHDKANVNK